MAKCNQLTPLPFAGLSNQLWLHFECSAPYRPNPPLPAVHLPTLVHHRSPVPAAVPDGSLGRRIVSQHSWQLNSESAHCTQPWNMSPLCRGYMWNEIISKLFRPSSTSVWYDFVSIGAWKLAGNYFKIISQAYCSSWIFSNMFIVAEIILELLQRLR